MSLTLFPCIYGLTVFCTDVTHEHPSLGSAPSSYSEPVCMPEFGDRFPIQGKQQTICYMHLKSVFGFVLCGEKA